MGGGQLGGFGGSAGDAPGAPGDMQEQEAKRPELSPGWTERSAVLTPGDRVEYKFTAKAGETLLAAASSEAFDPALAIVDAAGKELARNDDRAEGDQSPFLAFRFPADGTYLLKVLSYRSAAGGKFSARFRTFVAPDATVGKTVLALPLPDPEAEQAPIFLRLPAKKGETYEVRADALRRPSARIPLSLRNVLGPTGVLANDVETIATPGNRRIFRATRDGDYYLEFEYYRGFADAGERRVEVDTKRIETVTLDPKGELNLDLAFDEIKLVEFPVKRGAIVRTSIEGSSSQHLLAAPMTNRNDRSRGDEAYGRTRSWTYFLPNRDNPNDVVRIFRADGTARLAILSTNPKPGKVTVRNTDSLPEWTDGESTPKLAIGESKLYIWRARQAELARVFAKSESFQVRLDLFTMDGDVANTLMDRKRRVAADDLYFPNAGVYIVRLTCDGFGGSGVATLRKGAIPSQPYTLGAVTKISLDNQTYGLYEVQLEAGKRYALTISDPTRGTRVDLLDDEGRFLSSPAISFESVSVYYFTAEKSGPHRLWLRGAGARTFRFEKFTAPSLGGG